MNDGLVVNLLWLGGRSDSVYIAITVKVVPLAQSVLPCCRCKSWNTDRMCQNGMNEISKRALFTSPCTMMNIVLSFLN